MCGIIGLVSANDNNLQNCKTLLSSLCNLEYRGYDSLGFSYITNNGDIKTQKAAERISDFTSKLNFSAYNFNTAIAHTRWATHGGVSEQNSHPHESEFASIVHNGIIENYAQLKQVLQNDGFVFKSQTDSEVVSHLVSQVVMQNTALKGEVLFAKIAQTLIQKLKGAYALAILVKGEAQFLLGIKNRSPLIVAKGEASKNFIASDAYAIAKYTNQFATLPDMHYSIASPEQILIFNASGEKQNIEFENLQFTEEESTKGSFSTFMEKEIYEQPQAIKHNLDSHITKDGQINFENVKFSLEGFNKICLVACGTSYYAAQLFKYFGPSVAKISAECEIASEFRYSDVIFAPKTLYIFISQSGETADTIAALDFVRQNIDSTSKTLAVVNVKHSTIAKKCDGFIECYSGREIGVASTKNFTNQSISLLLLALKLASKVDNTKVQQIIESLQNLSSQFYAFLSSSGNIEAIKKMAQQVATHKKVMFVARSFLYPIALEGALKLKELSYIPTEGIAAGELKHGPIALVDENLACICLVSKHILCEKTESSIQEILARKGKCLIISDYDVKIGDYSIENLNIASHFTSDINQIVLPFLFIPAVQLLSYFAASTLLLDVDKPRNLAKSVTVE